MTAVPTHVREEARLRVRLPYFRRRVDRARDLVREALARGPAYVGVSGGKDSVALFGLVSEVAPGTLGAFIDSGCETPSTLAVIAELRRRGFPLVTVYPLLSLPEMLRLVGAFGYEGSERLEGEWHWTLADYRRVLVDEPAARLRAMGFPVALLGLRRDESRGRDISLRKYGYVHERKDGAIIACPLADWSGEDTIAYSVAQGLPVSELYLDEDDPERAQHRTGAVIGQKGVTVGRYQEVRRRHPALWAALVRDFPGLSRFA